MSKVSDAKARQGYRQQGRHCEECHYVRRVKNPENCRVHCTCTLGGFAVKALATCDRWAENGSLSAAIEGGNDYQR